MPETAGTKFGRKNYQVRVADEIADAQGHAY
jgi:hypothetical protein